MFRVQRPFSVSSLKELTMTMSLVKKLWNDDAGFIVSAELILVATIGVLATVVGLSEVAIGLNEELEDVGSAFGAVNQTYHFQGICGHKGFFGGSCFWDTFDYCDGQFDINCNTPVVGETGFGGNNW